MMYEIGDELRIVSNESGHMFKIGEIVTVARVNRDDYSMVSDGSDMYYVLESDMESTKKYLPSGKLMEV